MASGCVALCVACAAVVSASAGASSGAALPPSARAPTIALRWPAGVEYVEAAAADRRLTTGEKHSFSYLCQARSPCKFPVATATDYFDNQVTVEERDFEVTGGGAPFVVHRDASGGLDTSRPAEYLLTFDATDKAGNRAQQVTIMLRVEDNVKPTITICGNATVVVEASHNFTYCGATAQDNIDGDITASMSTKLFYNGHTLDDNGIATAGRYGPHELALKTGEWTFKYRVQDSSGNVAIAQKTVVVFDSSPPVITVRGASPVTNECTDVYIDQGATAYDDLDKDITVRTYGGSRRSCNDINQFTPGAQSGIYTVTSDEVNGGEALDVWCDMETDGGGYTYYPIMDGKATTRYDQANSCTEMGLQLAVWRTEAHMHAMLHRYGTKYFAAVPGVYGKAGTSGHSFSKYSMFSSEPEVNKYWRAIDTGSWFIRGTPFAQPNGDYTDGCWLGIFGFNPTRVNDDQCLYSTGTHYVCSTNDKGGPGVLPVLMTSAVTVASAVDMAAGRALPATAKRFPPAEPGNYTIVYQATDKHGLDATPKSRMVKVRDTINPTMVLTGFRLSLNPVWKNVTDFEFVDPGYNCSDTCDKNATLTLSFDKPFNPRVPNIYIRKYHCEDASGNVATNARSWVFVDAVGPMIALNGTSPTYIEAVAGKVYEDEGARCTTATHFYIMVADKVAGYMDDHVVSSGVEEVKADQPGLYRITYNCVDDDGQHAPQVVREVIVQDTKCVNLTMLAPAVQLIEAGFEYVPPDPEFIAYDALDGDLTKAVRVSGDTVDVTKSFITRTSCAEIKRDCADDSDPSAPKCPSGDYWITTFPKNRTDAGKHGIRLKVYCDMVSDGGGYTLYPVRAGKRISRYDELSTCDEKGLQVVVPRTKTHFERMVQAFGTEFFRFVPGIYGTEARDLSAYAMKSGVLGSPVDAVWKAVDNGTWWMRDSVYRQPSGDYQPGCWLTMDGWDEGDFKFNDELTLDGSCPQSVDTYLCSTNDKGGFGTGGRPYGVELIDSPGIFGLGAEVGKYNITYHVTDAAGNHECHTPSRIVIVKDTMPPELTLKYGNNIISKSDVSKHLGIGGVGESSGVISDTGFNVARSAELRGAVGYQDSSGNHGNYAASSYVASVGSSQAGTQTPGRRLLGESAVGGGATTGFLGLAGVGAVLLAVVGVVRRARVVEAELCDV